MNSLLHTRLLAAAALALGVFGAASAHARSDVNFFVGFGGPVYLEPAPVYVQPQPVYVQPQPVYSQPPVYVQHNAPAYQYTYEDERARRAEWRRWQWRQQQHNRHDWEHAREHEHEHEHERDHERHGRD